MMRFYAIRFLPGQQSAWHDDYFTGYFLEVR